MANRARLAFRQVTECLASVDLDSRQHGNFWALVLVAFQEQELFIMLHLLQVLHARISQGAILRCPHDCDLYSWWLGSFILIILTLFNWILLSYSPLCSLGISSGLCLYDRPSYGLDCQSEDSV